MLKKATVVLFLVLQGFWLSGCTEPVADADVTPGKPLVKENNDTVKHPDNTEFTTNTDTIQKIIEQAESAVKNIKSEEEKLEPNPDTHADTKEDDKDDQVIKPEPDQKTEPEPVPQPKPQPKDESAEIPLIEPKPEIIEPVKEAVIIELPEEEKTETESKENDKTNKKPAFYQKCEKVFPTFVDKNGNVDYKYLKRKRIKLLEASKALNTYDPKNKKLTEKEEIALWINAHNIYTLKLIIDNYPVELRPILSLMYPSGIMHIPGGRDKTYFKVMGREFTLKEIEKEKLINRFKDPRICFTLSFASMGGAFLRNEPYYPEKIEQQIQEQAKKFINNERGMKIDRDTDTVYLSDIFFQYKDAFIAKYGDIKRFREKEPAIRAYLNCIIDYLPEDKAKYIELHEYTVKYMKYDWNLNETNQLTSPR